MPRLDLAVALGVGVAGALVDVSSYARLTDGLQYRWGRSDAFYGAEPGTFSFVLDNADGRFTPENPNSPLSTTLTEGMAACISVEGRLTAGTVRSIEPEFPSGEAAWSRVRVTCNDALGDAARTLISDDIYGGAATATADGYWPCDDPAGSNSIREVVAGIRSFRGANLTLGVDGVEGLPGTQAQIAADAGQSLTFRPAVGTFDDTYSFGWWNFWVTDMTGTGYLQLVEGGPTNIFGIRNGRFWQQDTSTDLGGVEVGRAYFVSVKSGGTPQSIYIDGELVFTAAPPFPPLVGVMPQFTVGDAAFGASRFLFSRISASQERIPGEQAFRSTAEQRLSLVDLAVPELVFDTFPAFTSAPIGPIDSASSALDVLNGVLEAEQGYVSCVTTGTLTSPTQKVLLRGRDRPESVTATFDVEDELSGAPAFVRDLTNLVASVNVSGPTYNLRVIDSSLVQRAGSASSADTLPFFLQSDSKAWAQDRINRGANTTMQIASVVVDAMTTPTDRSADLLALVPGDRVQFTGLPSTQLGFDTWDGWFLGADETHTLEEHTFALYFQPVLPAVAKYDTAKYMASGEITTNGSWTLGGTSVLVKSTGAGFSSTAVPYVMQVDDEQVNVTAVSGSPSAQTLTVTRGVNGTTAATHAGDTPLVGPIPESIYAF